MPLPKSFTTVTMLSKTLAMILFIVFPFLGFYAGIQYEKKTTPQAPLWNQIITPQTSPTPTCRRFETICDPNSPNDVGGCAPKQVCVDPSPTSKELSYESKELCESQTGKICEYSACDYAPAGKTQEEVCGNRLKKGWYPEQTPIAIDDQQRKNICEEKGGKWLDEYKECEGASGGFDKKACTALGGEFTDCDSACRHDPKAQGCIEVCIQVCKFNKIN